MRRPWKIRLLVTEDNIADCVGSQLKVNLNDKDLSAVDLETTSSSSLDCYNRCYQKNIQCLRSFAGLELDTII